MIWVDQRYGLKLNLTRLLLSDCALLEAKPVLWTYPVTSLDCVCRATEGVRCFCRVSGLPLIHVKHVVGTRETGLRSKSQQACGRWLYSSPDILIYNGHNCNKYILDIIEYL
jgi:hypothetical protein